MTDAPPVIAPVAKRSRVVGVLSGLGAVASLLTLAAAHLFGLLYNALFIVVLAAVPCAILLRGWSAFRKKLLWRFAARPFGFEMRRYLLQGCNRCLFWVLLGVMLSLALPVAQLAPDELRSARWLLCGCITVLLVLELFPRERLSLPFNLLFALGWAFLGVQFVRVQLPPSAAEAVLLDPPFHGEWYVFHGGRSSLMNHHFTWRQQRHALDILKLVGGRSYKGDDAKLESYAAFGQDLLAPADGVVAAVVHDQPDQPIGGSDLSQPAGNRVVIEIAPDRFVMLAHLLKDSATVAKGDRVSRGQRVGRCGNSGNTSEPHLHLQVQNRVDFEAKDLRTFPILFRNVTLARGGRTQSLPKADVRRNDRIAAQTNTSTS